MRFGETLPKVIHQSLGQQYWPGAVLGLTKGSQPYHRPNAEEASLEQVFKEVYDTLLSRGISDPSSHKWPSVPLMDPGRDLAVSSYSHMILQRRKLRCRVRGSFTDTWLLWQSQVPTPNMAHFLSVLNQSPVPLWMVGSSEGIERSVWLPMTLCERRKNLACLWPT